MDNWLKGTSYAPHGAFLSRNAGTGDVSGLTPQGQGAFRGIGGALAGAGQSMMQQGPGQAPAHPALMFAQGMQNATGGQGGAQQPNALAALLQRYGRPS